MDVLQILNYATPFITMGLGWWFTTNAHKQEAKLAKQEQEKREEKELTKKHLENVDLRISTLTKLLESKKSEDTKDIIRINESITKLQQQVERLNLLNSEILSYALILGELTESITKGAKDCEKVGCGTKSDISASFKKYNEATRDLNEKVIKSAFINSNGGRNS